MSGEVKGRSRALKADSRPVKPAAQHCGQEVSVDCKDPNRCMQ